MSYWYNPVSCFNEIFRILKSSGEVHLFEPQKDINLDEVGEIIKENLADKNPLRRFAAVNLNKFGLKRGRTIGLNLYTSEELEEIAHQSHFPPKHSKLTSKNMRR